jgi:hypothetical protein
MTAEEKFNPKFGQLVRYSFTASNPASSASHTDMATLGADANTTAVMPASGSVVGIGVVGNAAVTTGTLGFRAHSSSTEFADTGYPNPTLSTAVGYTLSTYALVRPGAVRFSAGDKLGISYDASADFAPNTADYSADLYVMFDA